MVHYQSITRVFRPQTFHEVCGQKAIVSTLKNAIALNRVSHAYLFCGPRGVGKTTLARIFAKTLNCEQPTDQLEPCNLCSCCKEITAGQSLDVLEIDGASNRGIDDIRSLNETILYTPSSSRYKIYIIDEVHMLTKEAFNALLKTLEEPPSRVKFFFATTEPHKILPTILSRCQRFDLHRIPLGTICDQLKLILKSSNTLIDDQALYTLAKCADGSLRDAESLLDQVLCIQESPITFSHVADLLGLPSKELLFGLDQAFANQDLTFAFKLVASLYEEGKDLGYFLELLTEHYSLILKCLLGLPLMDTHPDKASYLAATKIYSKDQCLYILEHLMEWIDKLHKISCKKIHLELILVHIILSKQRINIDTLISSLQNLKQEVITIPSASTPSMINHYIEPTPSLTEIPLPSMEIPTPLAIEEPAKIVATEPLAQQVSSESLQRTETLLRFAAVELNGILKKSGSS